MKALLILLMLAPALRLPMAIHREDSKIIIKRDLGKMLRIPPVIKDKDKV